MRQLVGRSTLLSGVPLVALCCLACAPLQLHGQTTAGAILGTVTDSTGAIVPGATIVVTNLDTAAKRTDTTDKNGSYRVGNLAPGRYREDIESSGFKHFTREPITVEVDSSLRLDIPMELGATSETVTVTTQTPLLQSESASLSQVVDSKTVQEMPLNGRNVLNLIALTPGVVTQGGTAGASGSNQGAGHTNSAGWNNYQVGGGLSGQSASFLDGAPINELGGNTVQLVTTQDAIDEFRVASNSVSAEFGRFGGGVVNYATKSGSNDYHGSAYEYFRNKVLNAATFFGNRTGQPKAAFNQNQFGGTFGGHVKKDKSFFFVSYEQYKILQGTTVLTTLPTAAERTGDFSADAPIYDPYTTVGTGATATRQQFPGNKIPASRFDVAANAIINTIQYFPLPNTSQSGGNYAATRTPGAQSKQGTARFDQNIGDKQHLFARYTNWDLNDIPLNSLGNQTGGAGSDQKTQQGVLGDTYSFSPNTTFDLRLSVIRGFSDDNNPHVGRDLSVYGPAWATLQNQVTFPENIGLAISGLYAFGGMTQNSKQYRDVAAIAPSVATVRGRHTLKAGADLRLMDFNYVQSSLPSGTFSFDKSYTSANGSASTSSGVPFASFLLGAATSGSINTVHAAGQYSRYQGYYVTDTWQVKPNLTVIAGVRWELPGAYMERHDLGTVFIPNLASSLGSNYHGGLALVNSASWPHRSTQGVKHDLFAPRLGVSYSPTATTVVRAGYGLAYLPMDSYNGAMPFLSPINTATTTLVPSVNNAGLVPLNTLGDPFPLNGVPGITQQSILEPSGRSTAYLNGLNGLSISGPVPTIRYPYYQQWNANLQQQFAGGTILQVAYAGARGTFLPQGTNVNNGSAIDLNQLPDQYDSMGSALIKTTPNPLAGQVNSGGSLNGANVLVGQLLRPFPQYATVTQTNAQGDNIYHSLQLSVEKRFARGGTLLSNYTWAKNIGNVSGTGLSNLEGTAIIGTIQDFNNLSAERALLNFDVRHRFVTSYVVSLPFGHRQRFLSNINGVAGGFVSGWAVNGIVTFQTGFPLSIAAQNNTLTNSFGAGTIRPNATPGCAKQISGSSVARVGQWFNTACFTAPPDFSFGNEPRVDTTLRAAGIANYDLSASKETGISDRLKLQMRAEIFNLFNRVQFGPPATTLGASTFGIVTAQSNQPRQIQVSARLLF